VHGNWKPVTSRRLNVKERKKVIDNGKDTILPPFVTANCYTALTNNVVSSNKNGRSFPTDYGILCTDYNLETIL
jgi:hypothetical protein